MKKAPALLLGTIIIFLLFLSLKLPLFSLAGCDPPVDYSSCPELNPDWNLDILGYEPISGNLNFIPFQHPIDPNAPQFSTLIYGNPAPDITSLYQMYYWDWATNSQGNPATRPTDLPSNYDFATLVGFSTNVGQAIMVPDSGYDIGGGYGVLVIYADPNSITLKYTPDDNVSVGYTLYLENIQVDSNLLAYYNELTQAGRDELPALMAGMKIGEALGDQVLAAIRDTGMFLDPRWLNDWWQDLPPELLELILQALGLQQPIIPACFVSNPGDPDSRPVPCDACNKTDLLTGSCAESFSANDTVTFEWWEGEECAATQKEDYWVYPDWGGTVTIDPSDTTIPFVGKKGNEDEQKYLADYFEGTGFYYRPPYDFTKLEDVLRVFAEGGVWKKLAPLQLQDEMKKEMVNRAIKSRLGRIQEGAIHDYLVEYNGESAKLSEFAGHYPPENPAERNEWERETKWGRLWAAVPMFSREDTPGEITPHLGSRPRDTFEILNPSAQIEKVPHVARLYEVSQAINETLMPLIYEGLGIARGQSKTSLASAKDKILGEKTYLALAGGSLSVDFHIFLSPKGRNQYDLCWAVSGHASGGCNYCDWGYCIQPYGFCEPRLSKHCFTGNPSITCNMGSAHPVSVTANPGDTVCATLNITDGVCGGSCCDPDPRPGLSQTSCCQIDVNGVPTCGMGPVPEPPSCGLRAPIPVDVCYKPAITDPNPNDDLCCDPIDISLHAVDSFEITEWYKNCWEREYLEVPPRPCGSKEREVQRKVGISLLHPYLDEIWEYVADPEDGIFNIFRPETVSEFEPLDAASSIFYSYTPGSASPPGGDFYFPYLGGIQKAKEWVIAALNPKGGARAPGLAAPTAPTTLDYTIDFRNRNVTISDTAKNSVISDVLNSWSDSKIASRWDYVYDQAVAHGWNPAFVIALWIEESGASGVYAYDLGCEGAAKNDLPGQLECLFNRPYANTPFEEFMCTYATGHYPCVFEGPQVNFPSHVKFWYDQLTQ